MTTGQPPSHNPQQRPSQGQTTALVALFRAGQHAAALAEARTLAAAFPASLTAWNIRGAAARALGHIDEAETSFRTLEALDPRFAGAPYNLALALQDQGRTNEARAAYTRAIALDPKLAQAHNNLGTLLTAMCELEPAI